VQAIKPLLLSLVLVLAARAVQAEPFLYVPTFDSASSITVLSVFDTANDTRTGQAIVRGAVGTLAVRGVAFSPAGNRIYAASSTAVSVINTADNQIVASGYVLPNRRVNGRVTDPCRPAQSDSINT
jgi:hypothetical protein